MVKPLKNAWGFFGELWRLKKYVPEIKSCLQYFKQDKNTGKILENMINIAKNNPRLDNLLKISKTHEMLFKVEKRAEEKNWNYACQEALKEMEVDYTFKGIENIPVNGGALYVCNHPYGILDGAILFGGLGYVLNKKERKLKVIVKDHFEFIKEIEKEVYFVPSKGEKTNLSSIRSYLKYLDDGGDLAIYPSGRISNAGLKEYPWKNGLKNLITHSSNIVPMWFSGPNHAKAYNFFSKFKKTEKLRNIFSLKELWNKEGKRVILNIGKPIKSSELKERKDIKEKGEYLRKIAETLKVAV